MAKIATKAKKATPTTPGEKFMQPHELVLSPTIQSAVAIEAWSKYAGTVDLSGLVDDLRERVEKVQGGDMRPVEAMLYGQAMTLETIFTNLARRAASQEYLKQFQAYLGLALKAQAQCRSTLEALAEIKNPRPISFVKQANIANGPQQVNNGAKPERSQAHASAGDFQSAPNKLLEADHERMDIGAQAATGRADQGLGTVEACHRA